MQNKSIMIAFYKGKGRLFDKLIRLWTGSPYSHTEVAISGGPDQVSRCISSSVQDGGVREKYIFLRRENWDVVEIPGDPEVALVWLQENQGKKYDWLGVLGFLTPLKQSRNKWFCSEASAKIAGISDSHEYDPGKLFVYVSNLPGAKPLYSL